VPVSVTTCGLPDAVWTRLNLAWVGFFVVLSLLNLWVAYTFETGVWVNFKLGMVGLTVLFAIGQGFYIARYVEE
jgi:intracellular septation protein